MKKITTSSHAEVIVLAALSLVTVAFLGALLSIGFSGYPIA